MAAEMLVGKFKFPAENDRVEELEIPLSRFDTEKCYSVELESDDPNDICEYVESVLAELKGKDIKVLFREGDHKHEICKALNAVPYCILTNVDEFVKHVHKKRLAELEAADEPLIAETSKIGKADLAEVEKVLGKALEDEAKDFVNVKVKFAKTFNGIDGKTYEAGKTYLIKMTNEYLDTRDHMMVDFDPDCMDEVSRYVEGYLASKLLDPKSADRLQYVYAYLDDMYMDPDLTDEDAEDADEENDGFDETADDFQAAPKSILEKHGSVFKDGEIDHSRNEKLFKDALSLTIWNAAENCILFYVMNVAHMNSVLLGDEAGDAEPKTDVLSCNDAEAAAWVADVKKWTAEVEAEHQQKKTKRAQQKSSAVKVQTADGEKTADELIAEGALDPRAKKIIDMFGKTGTKIVGIGAGESQVISLDEELKAKAAPKKACLYAMAKVKFIKDVPDAGVTAGDVAHLPIWKADFDVKNMVSLADIVDVAVIKALYGEDADAKAVHDFKGTYIEPGDDVMSEFKKFEEFDAMYDTSWVVSNGSKYDFEKKTVDHSQNSSVLRSAKSAVIFNLDDVCKKLKDNA